MKYSIIVIEPYRFPVPSQVPIELTQTSPWSSTDADC